MTPDEWLSLFDDETGSSYADAEDCVTTRRGKVVPSVSRQRYRRLEGSTGSLAELNLDARRRRAAKRGP